MAKKLIVTIVALVSIVAMVLPGCTGGGGGELPSPYIGSGELDGNGIPVDFFTDLDVRKGFSYAFDYDTWITDALAGEGAQRASPIIEGLFGYDPTIPMYTYNLTKAEEHLKAAWGGQVWEKGFKFSLCYNTGNLARKTACEIMAENLANLNPKFQVAIQPLAWPTFLSAMNNAQFPMFLVGWLADYPHADNFAVPFMHSAGVFSGMASYGNAELDQLITDAFYADNTTEQLELYSEIQQYYHDNPAGIILAQTKGRRYFTGHISGFYYNPVESSYIGRAIDLTKAHNASCDIEYRNDGKFVEESIGEPESLDPAYCYDTASGQQLGYIYETLVYYDHEKVDKFLPILATNWTFNSTSLEYRFAIRSGVKFHNGNNMTPEDVEYSFERAMTQDRPWGPVWMFYQSLLGPDVWAYEHTTWADIDAAVEVDGDDVVFTLSDAAWRFPFLQILSGAWASIVDKEWCVDQGDWDGTEEDIENHLHPAEAGDSPIYDKTNGTGPWKLNTWNKGVEVIVDKNGSYWNTGVTVPFDHILTKLVTEWTSRKLSLINGDADLVYVPAAFYAEMDEVDGLKVYKNLPGLMVNAFFFNLLVGGP